MESELFEAATNGNVEALRVIVKNDKFILGKFVAGCFNWSPLHVAASQGHENFVTELLHLNLDLAQALDSKNKSAFHLAAAKGHIEVVKLLLIKLGSDVARDRLDRDETILHLCVKRNQFVVLKFMLATVKDKDFVNAKDDHGNTVLHMAVYKKQSQVIEYLLYNSLIEVNAKNANGQTALDILFMLRLTSKDAEKEELDSIESVMLAVFGKRGEHITTYNWQEKRDILMLIASVIGATSFQTAINPPGGFWQETSDGHKAGEAILATTSPQVYCNIMMGNFFVFFVSMLSMLLFTSNPRIFNGVLMKNIRIYSCYTIALMTITYVMSVSAVTPGKNFVYHEYDHGIYKQLSLTPLQTNNFLVVLFLFAFVAIASFACVVVLCYFRKKWLPTQAHNQKVLTTVRCASSDSSDVRINTE